MIAPYPISFRGPITTCAPITACGFNSMCEGEAAGARHFFLPMARQFDNQELRAARRQRALREARA